MNVIKNRIRLMSIVLTYLILFQSCRVYQRDNVSLDKAVAEQKRVKIKTIDGQKLKFKKITLDSSQYYGVKRVKGNLERTLLIPSRIKSIRLHNKTMSIICSTGLGLVIAFIALVTVAMTSYDNYFNLSGIQSPN